MVDLVSHTLPPIYQTQSEALSATSSSGKPVRLDFVGRVEDFDLDWSRLMVALAPDAVQLSPAERLKLIPRYVTTNNIQHKSSSFLPGRVTST